MIIPFQAASADHISDDGKLYYLVDGDNDFGVVDLTTGEPGDTIELDSVTSGDALAVDPTTGHFFASLRMSGSSDSILALIEPGDTSVTQIIGPFTDDVTNESLFIRTLEFNSDGDLIGAVDVPLHHRWIGALPRQAGWR